ncbi:MAG: hypothetical protein RB296_01565 [Acidobacteriota bacterium]|nr:hypothetical protein [Acidobacteriota bacterium]
MASQPDPASRFLAGLLMLVLLIAAGRRLTRTPPPHPCILPGSAPLLRLPQGRGIDLTEALPPDGSGRLLICRFPQGPDAFERIQRAWNRATRQDTRPLRTVLITDRPDRVSNLADWMRIPSPLVMDPDVFLDRLRVPGTPALLYFENGILRKCHLIAR